MNGLVLDKYLNTYVAIDCTTFQAKASEVTDVPRWTVRAGRPVLHVDVWTCVTVYMCTSSGSQQGIWATEWNMKWLHNLFARQSQNTRSLPVHTLFICTNGSNETRPAKKGNLSWYYYTETTLGNKSWRVEFCGYGGGLFIYSGTHFMSASLFGSRMTILTVGSWEASQPSWTLWLIYSKRPVTLTTNPTIITSS